MAARAVLRQRNSDLSIKAYCHAAKDFIEGPRFFRDKFGSVLAGTEHYTSDVVLGDVQRMFIEARDFGTELRQASLAARAAAQTPPLSPALCSSAFAGSGELSLQSVR